MKLVIIVIIGMFLLAVCDRKKCGDKRCGDDERCCNFKKERKFNCQKPYVPV